MGRKLINGQMNILELIDEFIKSVANSDDVDYLGRGRVLMSLAKDRMADFAYQTYQGLHKKILSLNYKPYVRDMLVAVRTQARKLLCSITEQDDETCVLIEKATGGRVKVIFDDEVNRPYLDVVRRSFWGMEPGDRIIQLKLTEDGENFFTAFGLQNTQFDSKRRIHAYTSPTVPVFVLADAALVVAVGIIYEIMYQAGWKEETFESIIVDKLNFTGGIGRIKTVVDIWRVCNHSDIMKAFKGLYEEEHSKILQCERYRNSASDYAASYQTKKNIPQKVLKSMSESVLNNVFGFVEFDEDVDLKKVTDFEKQFMAFHDTYFPMIDASKNAIRFRKLGNHKASGLYYPGIMCLCVDYRILTSTVHEFGHLIDYQMGNLSLSKEFSELKNIYSSHVRHAAWQKSDSMYKQLNGGTKYNLDYYLTPTEIFARSYEIYCSFVLGITNDLLPEEETFRKQSAVYPVENERYMKELTAYFNTLFGVEMVELKAV